MRHPGSVGPSTSSLPGARDASRRNALLALLLLVPAPSIGAYCGMVLLPDTAAGALLFAASKVWILGLPLVWTRLVDRQPYSLSPPRHGGFTAALLSGALMSGLILAVFLALGDVLLDRAWLAERMTLIGLGTPRRFLLAAAYWILFNSVLEEYVWRWFCVSQCERLMARNPAIAASALFFTLHHVVAMQVYLGPGAVAVGALGVFLGGAVWSLMYVRYRSIWPGYLSHALADLAIFGVAAAMLFGTR